jgi:hypothetical protein
MPPSVSPAATVWTVVTPERLDDALAPVGIVSVRPATIRSGSVMPFACASAEVVTLCWTAMPESVSPGRTV